MKLPGTTPADSCIPVALRDDLRPFIVYQGDDAQTPVGEFTGMALRPDGRPVIVYFDEFRNRPRLVSCADGCY